MIGRRGGRGGGIETSGLRQLRVSQKWVQPTIAFASKGENYSP